jgi:CheY-like chemotaxis protein
MEKARVLLIEDNKDVRDFVGVLLSASGHEVVGTAETYAQAIDLIGRVAAGHVKVDVIVLDGQLQDPEGTNMTIADIAQEIMDQQVQAVGIGFSSFEMGRFGVVVDRENGPVHIDLGKLDGVKLPELISTL